MYLLPDHHRENLTAYIQANPSPNVPIGDCMKLLSILKDLEKAGESTASGNDTDGVSGMYLLPDQHQNNLIAYIQTNPSPNVPVGDCMKLLGVLQQLEKASESPASGTDTDVEAGS